MKKLLFIIACSMITANVYAAGCVTNARGQKVCSNGSTTIGVNPNTGNAVKSTTNQYGVKRSENRYGGKAVTKGGYGAVQGVGGKTCVRTRRGSGCN